jgi:hypothetical protein
MIMYNTLVAQAQRMEMSGDAIVLSFTAAQKIGPTFEKYKPTLEGIATRLAGRKITLVSDASAPPPPSADGAPLAPVVDAAKKAALEQEARNDPSVQALFEVFPGEIRDVEEE